MPWGGACYTNEAMYVEQQAVNYDGVITADGAACLEFTREMLLQLQTDTEENIKAYYDFNKCGFVEGELFNPTHSADIAQ